MIINLSPDWMKNDSGQKSLRKVRSFPFFLCIIEIISWKDIEIGSFPGNGSPAAPGSHCAAPEEDVAALFIRKSVSLGFAPTENDFHSDGVQPPQFVFKDVLMNGNAFADNGTCHGYILYSPFTLTRSENKNLSSNSAVVFFIFRHSLRVLILLLWRSDNGSNGLLKM